MSYSNRVEELFTEGLEKKIYSAGAIVVGKGDQVLYSKAGGTVSYEPEADKVTLDTSFDMASCSKVVGTTFVAFHMLDQGMLCLDDTLGELLDNVPEDKKRITIRNLMTHTSGIPAEIWLWKEAESPEKSLDCILNTPLVYPTGTDVQYSCMGFITLGKVMEKISGKDLHTMAREWTFEPLGMWNTEYRGTDSSKPDTSIAYTELHTNFYEGVPGIVHDENARYLGGISGNAGLFSTANDLTKFCVMMAKKGEPIVSHRLFELASKNYTPGLSENRGLGFQLSGPTPTFFGDLFGNTGIGHTGYTGTSIAVDPESGLFVVYLTNRVYPTRDEGRLTRLRHQIHNAAVSTFL
ncbi:MAG: beta-lactamase family protein [Lachnospiraceae bacterium]|nr:beta-lactamase family protein [Lachnospiraceae bacterium]